MAPTGDQFKRNPLITQGLHARWGCAPLMAQHEQGVVMGQAAQGEVKRHLGGAREAATGHVHHAQSGRGQGGGLGRVGPHRPVRHRTRDNPRFIIQNHTMDPNASTHVPPLRAADVLALQDRLLADATWPGAAPPPQAGAQAVLDLWHWVTTNHRFNSLLWAEEDLARRTQVADADIAANKRAIDRYNQARNDATERVDEWLLQALGLVDAESARTDAPRSLAPAGARLNLSLIHI